MHFLKKDFYALLLIGCLQLILATQVCGQETNQYYEQGIQKFHQSDWDGAITNFTKAIEDSFRLFESYNDRAYAKVEKGDAMGAIADCNEAINLQPNYSGSYYWRSRINLELTNFDSALADFEIGLRLNPNDRPEDLAQRLSFQCRGRGSKNYHAGDLDGDMTNLNMGIHICPTNWSLYSERGFVKVLQGHFGSAIADEYFAIKHNPESPWNYEVRAWARYELHDVSGATEDCKKALEIYGQLQAKEENKAWVAKDSLSVQGLQNYINGDFEKASQEWTAWLRAQPKVLSPFRTYLEKWTKKAQAQLKNKTP